VTRLLIPASNVLRNALLALAVALRSALVVRMFQEQSIIYLMDVTRVILHAPQALSSQPPSLSTASLAATCVLPAKLPLIIVPQATAV